MDQFLSLNELSERAEVSVPTLMRLMDRGVLQPDGYSRNETLFLASRISELKRVIAGNFGIGRATAARIEQLRKQQQGK